MFFIQKLINNNLFKNNHIIILWNVLQVISFQNCSRVFSEKDGIHRIKAVWINIKKECLTLSSFCRSQLGLILRVGLTLKSSSKITLGLILRVGLIIGETRYIQHVIQKLFLWHYKSKVFNLLIKWGNTINFWVKTECKSKFIFQIFVSCCNANDRKHKIIWGKGCSPTISKDKLPLPACISNQRSPKHHAV